LEVNTFGNRKYNHYNSLHDGFRGFYKLYQIERNSQGDESEPDRDRQLGLKSPYGQLHSIASTYHWTLEYIMWGIPWMVLQRMLIDAPRYETAKKEETKQGGSLEEIFKRNLG
jgi:hypothetical protein